MRSTICRVCLVFVVMTSGATSQEEPIWYNDGSSLPVIVRFFAPLFFPKVMQDVSLLRDYIRSSAFHRLRALHGDRMAVDDIFARAMDLSWGNSYEALFLSFVSTIDHRRVGIRAPWVGALFWFPLTSEFPDEFTSRVNALPQWLYEDTPPEGDRDKLQHFFGSALLTLLYESPETSARIGDFVEWGEEAFIVGGVMDDRDRRANGNGEQFGMNLLEGRQREPSEFLDSGRK